MKNVIILHGKPGKEEYYDPSFPSASNFHWIPWLQKQLIVHDIKTDTPEIPFAYDPEWGRWCKEVERFEITSDTALVGHSCGAGFWLRYLSEHPNLHVGKVVLVAPSLGYGADWGKKFFEGFTIDPQLTKRTKGLIIFGTDNDHEFIQAAVKDIRKRLPEAKYKEFPGMGHFTHLDMKTVEFPELVEELLK